MRDPKGPPTTDELLELEELAGRLHEQAYAQAYEVYADLGTALESIARAVATSAAKDARAARAKTKAAEG